MGFQAERLQVDVTVQKGKERPLNPIYHLRVSLLIDFMEKTMHCQNCGTEAQAGQKSCRVCGVILTHSVEDAIVARTRRRLRLLVSVMKLGGYTITLAVSLALSILLAWMGIHLINQTGNIRGGVLLLVFAASLFLTEALLIYYVSLHAKVFAQPAGTNNKLLSKYQSWIGMSLTEQTTALLEEKNESRSVDQ